MTLPKSLTFPQTPSPSREPLLRCWLLIAFAITIAAAVLQDYRIVQEFSWMRTTCLVAVIVAGVGIAFCLGGAMHYVDELLDPPSRQKPAWYFRLLLVIQKRLLMLTQLAATALVLGCFAAMFFDLKIPGPDYSMLYPGGYTPPPLP